MSSPTTLAACEVLIIEDEADLRATIREVLEDAGYRVSEASNGLEAQERLATVRPSVILLDLMMPVMNGWDFLAWLQGQRDELARIPVVVVSAASRDKIGSASRASRIAAALEKPVRLDDLLGAVARFTERKSA